MPAVLLIDDHPSILECLQTIATSKLHADRVATARTAEQAVQAASAQSWDLIVTDISMPGRDGPELIAELHRLVPNARIMVYTVHDEAQFGVRALRAGAHGYINKAQALPELVNACQIVISGRRYISPRLAELLADSLHQPALPHERLSDRELEIMRLISVGQTPSEIAAKLHISPKTVGTYRMRILEKLEVDSTADIIRYALSHNLA